MANQPTNTPNFTEMSHTPPPPPEFSGEISAGSKTRFPNPPETYFPNRPDPSNPDPVTLREQWRFATRQYGKWYSHAWGTAILAGISFFALGWFIKGGNPLTSFKHADDDHKAKGD
ncbi:uncharacterized protein LOC105420880 [Amborella trichopoda]|uniref:uncharacterized protein LOC105420880 n=1 Tax=Amborella trichopoda TaxID=13333 RepID=UPI0005D3AB85|nr:uncharacterized protein LOC105420880 [Amborella trichopoda]|eukprot:XP_011624451.1 uncharacterized protein LOC105420880 [Amborella trichopoda]